MKKDLKMTKEYTSLYKQFTFPPPDAQNDKKRTTHLTSCNHHFISQVTNKHYFFLPQKTQTFQSCNPINSYFPFSCCNRQLKFLVFLALCFFLSEHFFPNSLPLLWFPSSIYHFVSGKKDILAKASHFLCYSNMDTLGITTNTAGVDQKP